ncbi:hypothetical protein BDY21DRAFT_16304 [Lineolata rhizophorae]|uniref:F-box domain-containing protein n=1 Tax=Lineolata rhizophorae TaxID=578093 RepID=A0A6A6P212_9PEZI|nr:hypothetical protein BDY21DRAFT_16304 [Lineolata rhizophorae]
MNTAPPRVPPWMRGELDCHLLRLPTELRFYIFRLVFEDFDSHSFDGFPPGFVIVRYDSDWKKTLADWPSSCSWGTRRMSRLLELNRQLHLEVESVLYSHLTHVFFLSKHAYITASMFRQFLRHRSSRVPGLIRRVVVPVRLRRHDDGFCNVAALEDTENAFRAMREGLPNLSSVALHVTTNIPVKNRDQALCLVDQILALAKVFRGAGGVKEVSLLSYDREQEDAPAARLVYEASLRGDLPCKFIDERIAPSRQQNGRLEGYFRSERRHFIEWNEG